MTNYKPTLKQPRYPAPQNVLNTARNFAKKNVYLLDVKLPNLTQRKQSKIKSNKKMRRRICLCTCTCTDSCSSVQATCAQ